METATAERDAVGTELQALRDYVAETQAIGQALSLLSWDEQTKMPPKAGGSRARQKAALAGLLHERTASTDLLRLVEAVEDTDPGNVEARKVRRGHELATRIPGALVREKAEASSHARHAWETARAGDDFELFAPHLERLLDLTRQQAEHLGYEREPWDALHDLFEEGMTAIDLEPLFDAMRGPINELIDRQPEPDVSLLQRSYPVEVQEEYSRYIVGEIGFDLDAGRIDPTAHPFCIGIGAGDVRLTTRYDEHWLPAGLFATIHEAGHGIYNQRIDGAGLPPTLATAPGLGMHESQSRMFENVVGRSRAFWSFHFPELQRRFPEALGSATVDEFHRAINTSQRSLIRVEADELTYNLHIGVRFELERALVNGDMSARETPEAWNDAMQRWLGVVPPTNSEGVLQDVHWSYGSFGYFPTYTLGNIYAAQFVEVAEAAIGDLDEHLVRGDLGPLLAWFDEHVYQHGRTYTGREFVERITGGPVRVEPLLRYLERKFGQGG